MQDTNNQRVTQDKPLEIINTLPQELKIWDKIQSGTNIEPVTPIKETYGQYKAIQDKMVKEPISFTIDKIVNLIESKEEPKVSEPIIEPKESSKMVNLDKWKTSRMTNESHYPVPEPMIAINGQSIATAGNIMVISGIQKSAKTSISMVFLACFVRGFIEPIDGVPTQIAGQPAKGKANLHFDSEQAKHKYLSNIKAMLRRLNKTEIPKNLYAYSLRGQAIDESLQMIVDTFELANKECGGIHSCFIDGIADLVNSVNDELESDRKSTRLNSSHALTSRMPSSA